MGPMSVMHPCTPSSWMSVWVLACCSVDIMLSMGDSLAHQSWLLSLIHHGCLSFRVCLFSDWSVNLSAEVCIWALSLLDLLVTEVPPWQRLSSRLSQTILLEKSTPAWMCGAQVYYSQKTEKMLAWVLASTENILGSLQVPLLSGTKLWFRKHFAFPCNCFPGLGNRSQLGVGQTLGEHCIPQCSILGLGMTFTDKEAWLPSAVQLLFWWCGLEVTD